jgi:hypothetical protein
MFVGKIFIVPPNPEKPVIPGFPARTCAATAVATPEQLC